MAGSNTYSQLPEEKDKKEQQPVVAAPEQPATTPPAAPSNYSEVLTFLQNELGKAETPEQKKKRERREKWAGIISGIGDAASALSNLFFTTQGAPNMYDGTNTMSAKMLERREKAKAERAKQADRYLNYAMTIGKLKDADRDFNFRQQQAAQAEAWRKKQFDAQQNQWQQTFDRQGEWHQQEAERLDRQFTESVRQFEITSTRQQQALNLQARQLAHQMATGSMEFNLGTGHGNVRLTQQQLNAQNVSRIYYTLPEEVRKSVHGTPIYGTNALGVKEVVGYGDPSTEAMLIAIGQHLATGTDTEATRKAIKDVAGQKEKEGTDWTKYKVK